MKPGRLILEPHRIGLLFGSTLATLVLLVQLFRQWQGAELAPTTVIFGVCATFIVAYGGAGLFVIYLLYVAEKELDVILNSQQKADKSAAVKAEESSENEATGEDTLSQLSDE